MKISRIKNAVLLLALSTVFFMACSNGNTPIKMSDGISVINAKALFPEGPTLVNEKLYYVEYAASTVLVWDGKTNTVFWKQEGTGPSAVIPAGDGTFLVTCYDSNQIARISAEGKTVALYDKDKNGNSFQGPNDFVSDSAKGVYFTCSGPWESAPIAGKIYYMMNDVITEVANDLHYANGIVLSLDGKTLYCAESEAHRIIQFDVQNDGSLINRKVFAFISDLDPVSGEKAYPDGLKMDKKGNLYICQYSMGRILVIGADAKLIRTINVPSPAAPNLNFSANEDFVYITAIDNTKGAPYEGKVYMVPNK